MKELAKRSMMYLKNRRLHIADGSASWRVFNIQNRNSYDQKQLKKYLNSGYQYMYK